MLRIHCLPISIALLFLVSLPAMLMAVESEKITVTVHGMHCGSCAESITTALKLEKNIEAVNVELKEKKVVVTTFKDTTIDSDKVSEIIQDLGYEVKDIDAQ